eukprot:scaffold101_cov373-Prasinococcus_capsulatus_cf.AAC.3
MAEVENSNGSAPAAAAAAAPVTEAPKVPSKIVRYEKPDKAAHEAEVAVLLADIDKCQERMNQLKAEVDGKIENRRSVATGAQLARQRLIELRAEFKVALDEKNAVREELQAADKAREQMRNQVRSIKEKLSFMRVEQIDEEIQKLEYKMQHSSLSIQEEKRIVSQIKDLNKSRDFVKEYNDKMEKINEDEGMRKEIKERFAEKDAALNALKAQEMAQRRVIDDIKQKEEAEVADVPSLTEEKSSLFMQIKEKRGLIRKLRNEFYQKEDQYYQAEREFRAAERERRAKEYEARVAERKRRDEERRKREEESKPPPFEREIVCCEQLVSYLEKLELANSDTTKSDAPAPKETEVDHGDLVMLKKDNDEIENSDMMFGGLGGKGKKKNKKGKAPKPKEVKLTHDMEVFSSFSLLKVEAPTLPNQIPACKTLIQEKKVEYEAKKKKALEDRANGIASDAEANGADEKTTGEDKTEEAADAEMVENDADATGEEPDEAKDTEKAEEEPAPVEENGGEAVNEVKDEEPTEPTEDAE